MCPPLANKELVDAWKNRAATIANAATAATANAAAAADADAAANADADADASLTEQEGHEYW